MKTPSSLYPPLHPPGTHILVRPSDSTLSFTDHALVILSSLFIVGSVAWVPLLYAWAWKKWKQIPKENKRKRAACAALLLSATAVMLVGPHRSERVGKLLDIRRWRLWKAWLKYIAFEVVSDFDPTALRRSGLVNNNSDDTITKDADGEQPPSFDVRSDRAIFAVIPHGIFPFAFGFAALPEAAKRAFGEFRPVVATATALLPLVRTLIAWLRGVDASRYAVDHALSEGARIGLAPGGIAEMFEGYPKSMTHPDDECSILSSRKGFIRLAVKHGIPVVPVYCFGATKMLKRLQLPALEYVSRLLRISLCLFFGRWGLPIPFRQRLLYVMGRPISPPNLSSFGDGVCNENKEEVQRQVDFMHKQFCDSLVQMFDRHKESYGWDRKTLRLV